MSDLRRDDLRVVRDGHVSHVDHYRVTDGELRQIPGLVELLLACEDCDGTGTDESDVATAGGTEGAWSCPACDGTGINPAIRHRLLTLLLPVNTPGLVELHGHTAAIVRAGCEGCTRGLVALSHVIDALSPDPEGPVNA